MPNARKLRAGMLLCSALLIAGWVSNAAVAAGADAKTSPDATTQAKPASEAGARPGIPLPKQQAAPPRRSLADELQLNDEQRKKVEALMDQQREVGRQHMQALRAEQKKLHDLYQADEWDADAIMAVQERMYKQRMDLVREMINTRNAINKMLDAQQRERFKHMMRPPQ